MEANSTNITAIVEPLRRLPNIMNVSNSTAPMLPWAYVVEHSLTAAHRIDGRSHVLCGLWASGQPPLALLLLNQPPPWM